jgi:hypothetical protein
MVILEAKLLLFHLLLIKDMQAKAVSGTTDLGQEVRDLLLRLDLLRKELALNKVSEVGVVVIGRVLVQFK